MVDSEQTAGRHGQEPGADIALYLARHDAHVEVEQVLSQGAPVADIILSYAAEHLVDLIVIGAYSRVEMMLGGINQKLLREAPIPVLMSRCASFPCDKPEALARSPHQFSRTLQRAAELPGRFTPISETICFYRFYFRATELAPNMSGVMVLPTDLNRTM
jgi:hypothetical protein